MIYRSTITITIRALAYVAAIALSPSVAEGTRQLVQPPQLAVRYDDLNIAQRADAEILLHRLRTAATHVCASWPADEWRDRHRRMAIPSLTAGWRAWAYPSRNHHGVFRC